MSIETGRNYEFTDEIRILLNGTMVHRIKALRNFRDVQKGDLGGFIESYSNLADDAWVYNNAMVYGEARIYGEASVHNEAHVCGNARVYDKACVCDSAHVLNDAMVFGEAMVCGNALVCGDAEIHDHTVVCGYSKIYGTSKVIDYTALFGDAKIKNGLIDSRNSWLIISNIGSRNGTTTFYKGNDGRTLVTCGCFFGTIEEFKERVIKVHKGSLYEQEYLAAIELAKIKIR